MPGMRLQHYLSFSIGKKFYSDRFIAAISLVGAGLITCCFVYTTALLSVKILLALGIASLTIAGAYKAHQRIQPYFRKKYDDLDVAIATCQEIRTSLWNGDDEFFEINVRANFKKLKKELPKRIKDWTRYGYIMPQFGKKLTSLFYKKMALFDTIFEQEYPDLIRAHKLIKKLNNYNKNWDELLENDIFPRLPFEISR